jgi:hypothetical protein
MAFIGQINKTNNIIYFDRGKLKSSPVEHYAEGAPDSTTLFSSIVNMQTSYGGGREVSLVNGGVIYYGQPDDNEAKLTIIHKSSFQTDEGICFKTGSPTLGRATPNCSHRWTPINAYDFYDSKVFSVDISTDSGKVGIKSYDASGESGYHFINEPQTFIALDASGPTTALKILKSDGGYIDLGGYGQQSPVMRIETDVSASAVSIGTYGGSSQLMVNGMDMTPYNGSVIVPAGDTSDHSLIQLSDILDDETYGFFNIDVFAGTVGSQDLDSTSSAAWKFFITICKKSSGTKVVGITQMAGQLYSGPNSLDNPSLWNVEVNTLGDLFANTKSYNSFQDITFGAVVTKLSTLDIQDGYLLR